MRKGLKKLLYITVAFVLALSSLTGMAVFAELATPTFFADKYNVELDFPAAITDADIAPVSAYKYVTKTAVNVSYQIVDGTKLIITPVGATFEPGVQYVVKYNGVRVGFSLTTKILQNFNSNTVGIYNTTSTGTDINGATSGITLANSTTPSKYHGQIIEKSSGDNAFYSYGSYMRYGAGTAGTNYTLSYTARPVSVSGSAYSYGRYYYFGYRKYSGNTSAINFNVTAKDNYNISYSNASGTSSNITPRTYDAAMPAAYTNTNITTTELADWSLIQAKGITYSDIPEYEFAMRNRGTVHSMLLNGATSMSVDMSDAAYSNYVTTVTDATTQFPVYANGYFFRTGSALSEIIDDVMMTTSSNFEVVDTGEPVPTTYVTIGTVASQSITGVTLSLANNAQFLDVAAEDTSLVTIKNKATQEAVTVSSVALSGNSIIISANLAPDVEYTVAVASGFGDGAVLTESAYSADFTINANHVQIASYSADTTGITLTLAEGQSFEGTTPNDPAKLTVFNTETNQYETVTAVALNGNTITADVRLIPDVVYTLNVAAKFGEVLTFTTANYTASICVGSDIVDISGIYADTKGITLKLAEGQSFTETAPLDNSLVTILNTVTGNHETISSIALNGNEIYIAADLAADTIYSLKVVKKFGELAIFTSADYNKVFRINTYAYTGFSDCAEGALTAGAALDTNGKFSIGRIKTSTSGAAAEIINDNGNKKLYLFGDSTFISNDNLGNYSVTYNMTHYATTSAYFWARYYSHIASTGSNDVPYIQPGFSTGNTSRLCYAASTYKSIPHINGAVYPNAVRVSSDNLNTGTFAGLGVSSVGDGDAITFRAVDSTIGLLNDNTVLFNYTDSTMIPIKTGMLQIASNATDSMVIDNVLITKFELLGGASLMFTGKLNAGDVTSGNISSAAAVAGSVNVLNLATNASANCVAVIAVYAENNRLIKAYASAVTTVEACDIETVNYSLDNISGAVTVKAFLIDSLSNLKPYCGTLELE